MYQSQFGQDKFIDKHIFNSKRSGHFLEIGAYDGKTFSNTYYLENSLGWKGICIEPIPTVFEKLKKNRTANLENVCIGDSDDTIKFLHVDGPSEMLSGIIGNYEDEHMARVDKEIAERGGEKKIIEIKSVLLQTITEKYNMNDIDYCSMDVEGSEIKILSSIDFKKVNIYLLSIENNYNLPEIRKIMFENNYVFLGKLEADDFYIKNTSAGIALKKLKIRMINFLTRIKRKLSS